VARRRTSMTNPASTAPIQIVHRNEVNRFSTAAINLGWPEKECLPLLNVGSSLLLKCTSRMNGPIKSSRLRPHRTVNERHCWKMLELKW